MFKHLKQLDFTLIIVVLLLFGIGLVAIRTATDIENFVAGQSSEYITKQVVAFLIGIMGMVVIMYIDYQVLGQYWIHIYIACIILLLIVWIPGIGYVQKGTRGWINLGFMNLQTSEIVKIGFIIFFAKLIEKRKDKLDKIIDVAFLLIFCVPIIGLIARQPDLGQSLVFVVIATGMMFMAGLNMKYVYAAVGSFIVIFPILWNFFLLDYQKNRLLIVFNPASDPLGKGYHAIQSMTTIGSGGLYGKGLNAENTMTSLNFLPAQWTDFIFSVISETTGFVGGAVVVLLFGLFLYRLLKDSYQSKDEFGTLIILGVFFMFLFQIVENIGMTMGIMPITGITLPFLSYGGSSLMTNLMAIGLVLNVYMRRQVISFK